MDDETRVQERQQVKEQQFYAPAQTWQKYRMQGHMIDLKRYRKTYGEINFIEQIKAPIFLEAVLAIEMMWELKFNLEEKSNSEILKGDFSTSDITLVKQNKLDFQGYQKATSCPCVL